MGYNNGDTYEEHIYNCCNELKILPPHFSRAGAAADKPDVMFVHKGKEYNLEVKDFTNPDYGQRRIHFYPNQRIWKWAKQDKLSNLYENLGLKENIPKDFSPIWYQKRIIKEGKKKYEFAEGMDYTLDDLQGNHGDQKLFNYDHIAIPREALFLYYSIRNTFYIHIHKLGLYHLDSDPAGLGTTQFNGSPHFRFRVKRKSTRIPPHNCQFLGVMKLLKKNNPTVSKYNLDASDFQNNQSCPKIIP